MARPPLGTPAGNPQPGLSAPAPATVPAPNPAPVPEGGSRTATVLMLGLAFLAGAAGLMMAGMRGGLQVPFVPVGAAIWIKEHGAALSLSWLLIASAIIICCAAVGYSHSRSPFALLISDRNRFSLARFQMLTWSIVLIPAYISAAAFKSAINLSVLQEGGLTSAGMADNLWILLGGAIGTQAAANYMVGTAGAKTALDARASVRDARFSDFFYGETASGANQIDMARVQHFLVTVVIAIMFSSQLMAWLASMSADLLEAAPKARPIDMAAAGTLGFIGKLKDLMLPSIDQTLFAIIAASHATYLVSKPK